LFLRAKPFRKTPRGHFCVDGKFAGTELEIHNPNSGVEIGKQELVDCDIALDNRLDCEVRNDHGGVIDGEGLD
jgi:hypothetical protein